MGEQVEVSLAGEVQGEVPPGARLRRTGRMSLGPVPRGFSLHRTVLSHGWCELAPTAYDGSLYRTVATPGAGPLTVTVRQPANGRLEVSWGRVHGSCDDRIAIRAALRRMLALDDDLTDLHAALRTVPSLAWAAEAGSGRMLRSPTVFEDLVKTLATTNCSWALTSLMCRRLVGTLGEEGPEGERAFPTPSAVAAAGVAHFTDAVRAGYRSRAFVDLAESGLDFEKWLDPALPDDVVEAEILALRGFGPYASQGMLGLLGRPRGLAIDSWVRAKLPRLAGVDRLTDREIAERYAPLGRWAGMGLWLELTADWF